VGDDADRSSYSRSRIGEGAAGRLADLARPSLDRRLTRHASAPLIVALSGGGDSVALLLAAKIWADAAGRGLLAVTVDHRLQGAGAAWAAGCQDRCRRLGVDHRTLVWSGSPPNTGLAAAARRARHVLIADAARAAGARVILIGHTADDRLEARLMRAEGGSVSEPREWSPSPVWPEGRDLFILRPLIDVRRAALREILRQGGETWIDDPANDDLRQPRARARVALADGGEASPDERLSCAAGLLTHVAGGPAGDLSLPRKALRRAQPAARRGLIGAAVLCAAGTARPPRGERLARLVARLADDAPFAATLSGARVEAGDDLIRILREVGEIRRAGEGPLPLPAGAGLVWDGRFEIEARAPGLSVRALEGRASRLDSSALEGLKRVPVQVRKSLPALIDETGAVTCPSLGADARVVVRSLVFPRLAAALGAIQDEAAIGRVAECLATS